MFKFQTQKSHIGLREGLPDIPYFATFIQLLPDCYIMFLPIA